jgi:two-component system, NtrC family, sensor kinase
LLWIGVGFGRMLARLGTLFSTETFMARGHSYLWSPKLVILELATNVVIALAALAIAVALLRAAARAGAGPARLGHGLLALFAMGLAAAHGLDAWVIWTPLYGVDVVVRAATAVAAVGAAIAVPRMLRRG